MEIVSLALSYDLAPEVRQILASKPDFRPFGETVWECGDVLLHKVDYRIPPLAAKRAQHLGSKYLHGAVLGRCHSCPDYVVVGLISEHPIGVCMSREAFASLTQDQYNALAGMCQMLLEFGQVPS